jgi:transcriptional regulator with XRE-family HTH domain
MRKLRELRKSFGETQAEIARMLNVSDNTITKWELGQREPSFRNLKMLATHFNVSTDYLLSDVEVTTNFKSKPKTALQQLRAEQHMTLNELQEATSINRATLSLYERETRRKSLNQLAALADYYNVSLDYIFGRTEKREINK